MDDVAAVGGIHCAAYTTHDIQCLQRRKAFVNAQFLSQSSSLQEFHDEEGTCVIDAVVVNGYHVGVRETRRRPRLSAKTMSGIHAVDEVVSNQLHGNVSLE